MSNDNGSAEVGHNSAMRDAAIQNTAAEIIELKADKAAISKKISDKKNALKKEFDISKSAFNQALKLFEMEGAEQATIRSDYDICCEALGILAGTPLGDAALASEQPAGPEGATAH